ncbi:hypothetical protein [Streptomyces sp. NBC_00091]|uniref:hypothetical protein n=1 Tax=Streptomyces sp. NBC_00091 TaxID=2975648 RepID=UPI002258F718|nr:hypothetical protein [Streptomyces sp. NBC_00091]MCX5381289.1 hypothetical protein [Streptomyces sp. NBC_00091]
MRAFHRTVPVAATKLRVPAGFAADGLPLAVQLVGRRHQDTTVVQVAAQLEAVRPWTGRVPDLAREPA